MVICSVYLREGEDVIRYITKYYGVFYSTLYYVKLCHIVAYCGINIIPYHRVFYSTLYNVMLFFFMCSSIM